MLPEDIQTIVLQRFGLSEMWPGPQKINHKNRELEVFVGYIWVAIFDISSMQNLILAATRIGNDKDNIYPGAQKNMLWLHPPAPKGIRRKSSIKVAELAVNEADPVAEALTTMNLIPVHSGLALDAVRKSYEVFIFTRKGRAYVKYEGEPQSPNMRNFWDVLVQKAYNLADISDDSEVKQKVDRLKIPR